MREYRSRWATYTNDITVEGRRRHIVFTSLRDGGSYYVTSDEKEIEALEKKPDFNKNYFLYKAYGDVKNDGQVDAVKKEGDEQPKKKMVEDVTNIIEAREYLKKQGVDFRKLNSPKSVLKQAGEIGVEFPNLSV